MNGLLVRTREGPLREASEVGEGGSGVVERGVAAKGSRRSVRARVGAGAGTGAGTGGGVGVRHGDYRVVRELWDDGLGTEQSRTRPSSLTFFFFVFFGGQHHRDPGIRSVHAHGLIGCGREKLGTLLIYFLLPNPGRTSSTFPLGQKASH